MKSFASLGRTLLLAALCAGLAPDCESPRLYKDKDAGPDAHAKTDAGGDTNTTIDAPASTETGADAPASTEAGVDAPSGPTCNADEHVCSGACVSSDDPKSCGTSCTRC